MHNLLQDLLQLSPALDVVECLHICSNPNLHDVQIAIAREATREPLHSTPCRFHTTLH
jgi:hypothetical protein